MGMAISQGEKNLGEHSVLQATKQNMQEKKTHL